MMPRVLCPGCGEPVPEERLHPGSRFGCDHCAGLVLEVVEEDGRPVVREIHFASCPVCEGRVEVPREAAPGQTVRHCGRNFRLSYEFGAYALE